jgi:hypothetical protein
MSGAVGVLHAGLVFPDGRIGDLAVRNPEHEEVDFWICTCRWEADNADYFFGPLAAV